MHSSGISPTVRLSGMHLRYTIFHEHRHLCLGSATVASSLLALTTLPSFLPFILHLSLLLFYFPNLLKDRGKLFMLWIALSLAKSVSWFIPSLRALSSPSTSVAVLLAHGAITTLISLLCVFVYTRSRTRSISIWSRTALFPAIWATAWLLVAHVSPVGYLTSWSPITGFGAYNWLIPFLGAPARDWMVSAWAVVISEAMESWYMGSETAEEAPLLVHVPQPPEHKSPSTLSFNPGTLLLAMTLCVLAVPSFILPMDIARPVYSTGSTPLAVACILPPVGLYGHNHPTFEDYLKESRKFNQAKIMLWPEGAVTFADEEERADALARVKEVSQITNTFIGVSFEESYRDPADPTGRKSLQRTGLALVSNHTDSALVYYKRNLVPIAESFRFKNSVEPPEMVSLDLSVPKWIGPPQHRAISVTASICLDFAMPGVFANLESKPAVILAPGRTWDLSVGKAMWEQAKQRARELDTTILWCDGGDGGVSGVAGQGIQEETRVGEGSWVREIGLAHPFDERPTFYARTGSYAAMGFFWVPVLGVVGTLLRKLRFIGVLAWTCMGALRRMFLQWRESRAHPRGDSEDRNLLMDDD